MIQFKRGKTTSWLKNKTKLSAGQPGYDKDKHKIKIGDGEKTWAELPYASGLSSEEILSSEEDAKIRRNAAKLINPLAALLDSPAIITYGKESPDKDTVGQLYLQTYDAEPETDYIVDSGINAGWTYLKWKSGIASCWLSFEFTTAVQMPLEDSCIYLNTTNMSAIDYPFTFIEVPTEVATVQSPAGLVWLGATKKVNTESSTAIYNLLSVDKLNESANYKISIKVNGRWR